MSHVVRIGEREVGDGRPTYFIADVAANHDGDLERAKALIHLAAAAGADAAKFQNFKASKIVSDHGFRSLGEQRSHQASWGKSVFEVYDAASIPLDWTPTLAETCRAAGIDYLTSPYDFDAVDELSGWMAAIKIGSGDVTFIEIVERIAAKGKPVLLATGASDLSDVQRAVSVVRAHTDDLVLMQCNTNYTGSLKLRSHPSARPGDVPGIVAGRRPGTLRSHAWPCDGPRCRGPGRTRGREALHRRSHAYWTGSRLLDRFP